MRLGTTITVAFLLATSLLASQDRSAARERVDTAIANGISLLEAKEYSEFLQQYMSPGELTLTTTMPSEEYVRGFAQFKAPRLLEVLKVIQGNRPELDASGTSATFRLQPSVGGKESITFIRIEKYWYIKN